MTQPLGTESKHLLGMDNPAPYFYMLLAALLLAAAAYWAPWVDHDAAALRLAGQDMGEFVKFLPATQEAAKNVGGEPVAVRRIPRQLHYISPFVCTVCLTLLAANMQIAYPRWLRVVLFASAVLPAARSSSSGLGTSQRVALRRVSCARVCHHLGRSAGPGTRHASRDTRALAGAHYQRALAGCTRFNAGRILAGSSSPVGGVQYSHPVFGMGSMASHRSLGSSARPGRVHLC